MFGFKTFLLFKTISEELYEPQESILDVDLIAKQV